MGPGLAVPRPVTYRSAMTARNARSVTLGLVQMRCGEDPEENLERAVAQVDRAAGQGAQVVCLPELFRSRYFCQS